MRPKPTGTFRVAFPDYASAFCQPRMRPETSSRLCSGCRCESNLPTTILTSLHCSSAYRSLRTCTSTRRLPVRTLARCFKPQYPRLVPFLRPALNECRNAPSSAREAIGQSLADSGCGGNPDLHGGSGYHHRECFLALHCRRFVGCQC